MAMLLRYTGRKDPNVDSRMTGMVWRPGEVQVVVNDEIAHKAITQHPDIFQLVEGEAAKAMLQPGAPLDPARPKEDEPKATGGGGDPKDYSITSPTGETLRLTDSTKGVIREYLSREFGVKTAQTQSVSELHAAVIRLQEAVRAIEEYGADFGDGGDEGDGGDGKDARPTLSLAKNKATDGNSGQNDPSAN